MKRKSLQICQSLKITGILHIARESIESWFPDLQVSVLLFYLHFHCGGFLLYGKFWILKRYKRWLLKKVSTKFFYWCLTVETSERGVNLICCKWKNLFESVNRNNNKLYLRKVVSTVPWRPLKGKKRVFTLFFLKGTFGDSFKSFHIRIWKIFVHRKEFCKPDKTLNRVT